VAEVIKFGGEQGSITIAIQGYERPGTENYDDANWLRCEVTVKADPFSGMFRCDFTTHDLVVLAEPLKRSLASLSGTVTFRSTEQDVVFDIVFDEKRGTAEIHGKAQPHRWLGACLSFRLDTDQSYLAQSLREIEAVLRKFPVKSRA
jgi:hypothetical protein